MRSICPVLQNFSTMRYAFHIGRLLLLSAGLLFAPMWGWSNGWEHTAIPIDALFRGLDSDNAEIRSNSAISLGFRHEKQAYIVLLEHLQTGERDDRTRQSIWYSLQKLSAFAADDELSALAADCVKNDTVEYVRVACVRALGLSGSVHAEKILIPLLQHESEVIVRQTIRSLGVVATPQAVLKLIKLLDVPAKDTERTTTIIEALGDGGQDKAGAALQSLGNKISVNDPVQLPLLDALTRLRYANAVQLAENIYQSTSDARIRRKALIALNAMQSTDADSFAIEMLSSEDPHNQLVGLDLLRRQKDTRLSAEIGKRSLRLTKEYYAKDISWLTGNPRRTLVALSLINEYLRTIIALDPRYGFRLFATAASPPDIPKTSSTHLQLAEGYYKARWQGLYGLGYTFDPAAEQILAAASVDADPRIRAVALRSMGIYGAHKFRPQILGRLDDKDLEVRRMVAAVMGRDKSLEDIQPILAMLKDKSELVRVEAARSLGYLANSQAVNALEQSAVSDKSERVRQAAKFSLAEIRQ